MWVRSFPITQAAFRRRGTSFNPGKTYGRYVKNLRKADLMLGNEPTWHSADVRTLAKCLHNAQDSRFAIPNFAHADDRYLILGRGNNQPALARAVYISYLYPLRVHSVTLQLQRAGPNEPIPEVSTLRTKTTDSSKNIREWRESFLAIFKFRKTIHGGCVLSRPCLRHVPMAIARSL